MDNDQEGVWIDESTRVELIALLKEARRNIESRPDHGGVYGAIGRIETILPKLVRPLKTTKKQPFK